MTVKLRYKPIKSDASTLIVIPVKDTAVALDRSSENFRFSAAVAGFGMVLRDSQFKKDLTLDEVLALARSSRGKDSEGYRSEFIELVRTCALLKK
jgi:Ca-activated chloride channel family protein